MHFLYNISIQSYYLLICIASLFSAKAKRWLRGRKNIFEQIQAKLARAKSENRDYKLFWVHCASLGEFEQGRPLIEKLKRQNSNTKILLTFFSPSGYEIRKNYSGADFIFYLPIDTVSNATTFISIVKPDIVFFVKYEFWFNYLIQLKKRNIPTYLISGIFRKEQHFFKSYGRWFKEQLKCFTHFFVQDENSLNLLKSIDYTNVTISGDTRFDRVYEIAQHVNEFEIVKSFAKKNKVLIVGSAWKEDLKIISNFKCKNYKLIIAPHEINEATIQLIIQEFNSLTILRYSEANALNVKEAQLLIIDTIGILSSLYQYGTIAFIGGGFGKGIHNILEAATFGLPIVFGPNYEKFAEAKELIKLGGAFSIKNYNELEETMNNLKDSAFLSQASEVSKKYIHHNIGATNKIIHSINSFS